MRRTCDRRLAALLRCGVILAAFAAAPHASAQSLGFGTAGDETPVEVIADNGIEWVRDGKQFVARGNAVATRGDTKVFSDTLVAFYREGPTGKSELWRLEANGHAKIASPTETATGDTAVYDIPQSVLVLKGKPVARLVTPDTTITATDDLEYWDAKRMAVARGNAVVIRDNRTLKADVVTAYFTEKSEAKPAKPAKTAGKSGSTSQVDMVDAYGHVTIVTPTETVTGDKGRYNVKTGIATLLDNVTLARGQDTLKGAYAVVNMNSGVSTLYSRAPGDTGKSGPVRGVFTPKKGEPLPGAASRKAPAATTAP